MLDISSRKVNILQQFSVTFYGNKSVNNKIGVDRDDKPHGNKEVVFLPWLNERLHVTRTLIRIKSASIVSVGQTVEMFILQLPHL